MLGLKGVGDGTPGGGMSRRDGGVGPSGVPFWDARWAMLERDVGVRTSGELVMGETVGAAGEGWEGSARRPASQNLSKSASQPSGRPKSRLMSSNMLEDMAEDERLQSRLQEDGCKEALEQQGVDTFMLAEQQCLKR